MTLDHCQNAPRPESGVGPIDAHLISEVREALHLCRDVLATTPRDTSIDPVDALLFAVLCGQECEEALLDPTHEHDDICGGHDSMAAAAEYQGWSPEMVAKLRRLRLAVAILTAEPQQRT